MNSDFRNILGSFSAVTNAFLFIIDSQGAALKPALFLQKERQKLCKGLFRPFTRVQRRQSLAGVWGRSHHKNIFAQTLHKSLYNKATKHAYLSHVVSDESDPRTVASAFCTAACEICPLPFCVTAFAASSRATFSACQSASCVRDF